MLHAVQQGQTDVLPPNTRLQRFDSRLPFPFICQQSASITLPEIISALL
jgi:hypothetical protein